MLYIGTRASEGRIRGGASKVGMVGLVTGAVEEVQVEPLRNDFHLTRRRGGFQSREVGCVEFLLSLRNPTGGRTPLCIAVRRPESPPRHYEAVNRCGGRIAQIL
ncbi:hypothetical protein RB195_008247 [Necator americanus]|uniref:Uncharacterized protein n=1 Tax=Necator americanus TaxID=51031 RepID=A0ABR1CQC7_NECAM